MVFGADPTRRGVACRYCPEARPRPRPANETDACALRFMPKNPPPPDDTGPMGMQPPAHSPTAATQMLPLMPGIKGKEKDLKGETQQPPKQKEPPTRAEAVRAAWARITRRKSLRKQRDAQKG